MVTLNDDQILNIGAVLNNGSRPLKERFRALFTLRSVGGKMALNEMSKAFGDPSALLKHEVAYCIGQMGMPEAVKVLEDVLQDTAQEPIVRHEAGEALGAIGSRDSLPVLKACVLDPVEAVADTCRLAVARIEWLHAEADGHGAEKDRLSANPYQSVDPAPPALETDTAELTKTLLDDDLDIFLRYRAMFALRNKGDPESIQALAKGFQSKNALFRHEIAYVLGQISSELSAPALTATLANTDEIDMVRHEAAEALGSIGSANHELKKYLDKEVPAVVRESCVVALDIADYNNSEEFKCLGDL